jgi:small subunit ribosomal protein S20
MKKSVVKKKLSVLKRQRQAEEANIRNRARRSRARTFVKKFEKSLVSLVKRDIKDHSVPLTPEQVMASFPQVQSQLARAGHKGAFHEKAMSRKIKRLHSRMISVVSSLNHTSSVSLS